MRHRAFTLIELLVVIAIIGLLSTIAVVALNSSSVNARNQQRKSNLLQIYKALELYYDDNNGYPSTGGSGAWRGNCSTFGPYPDTGAAAWIPNLSPTYMAILPHDPNSGKINPSSALAGYCDTEPDVNCYLYTSDGNNYKALAHCTPEGTMSATDSFYDPQRPYWAWQVTNNASVTFNW